MPQIHTYSLITTIVNADRILISEDQGAGVFQTKNIEFEDFLASIPTFTQGSPGVKGFVPGATTTTDDGKLLLPSGTWGVIDTSYLNDFNLSSPAQYDFIRVNASNELFNTPPPSIIYTPDDESASYSGIDNTSGGNDYAQITDLEALRTAYENLRALVETIKTWLETNA